MKFSDLANDGDYLGLPQAERAKVVEHLASKDQDFQGLPEEEKIKVLNHVVSYKPPVSQEVAQEHPAPQKEGGFVQGVKDLALGQLTSAQRISSTLMTPVNKAIDYFQGDNRVGIAERNRADFDKAVAENADPNSAMFKTGKITGDIGFTMPLGGLASKPVAAVAPYLGRLAPAAGRLASSIQSGGFSLGNTGGNALANAATRVLGGAANGYVTAGAVDPEQANTGAVIGGALPMVTKLAGSTGNAFRKVLAPKDEQLASTAINKYEIPLGVSDITDNKMVKSARSILNDMPFIGSIGGKQKNAVQEGFNKAVGKTFGADATKLTPEVLDSSKQRMGSEFDRIWGQNSIKVDSKLTSEIDALRKQAGKLPRNEGDSLLAEIADFESKASNGLVPGDVANKFQQYLRRRAESSSGLKNELNDMRQSVISAFNRSIAPEDAAALTLNRAQYKAYKTVEPLLSKGEAGVAGREAGDIPASLLPNQVAKSYGNYVSSSPFADLSQIGSKYVADRVAQTGGSNRALLQNSAIGSAFGLGAYVNPLTAAAGAGSAALTNKALGSPALARKLLERNPGFMKQYLQNAGRTIPVLATE